MTNKMHSGIRELKIFVDGASRGNPGPAAYAFIFIDKEKKVFEKSEFIGKATNNVAEYTGIFASLQEAQKITIGNVKLYSDSQLAVRQLNKEYKIKANHLSILVNKIFSLEKKFEKLEFIHTPRTNPYINICDKLCNERLDAEGY
ncbi:MAG: Ribonuclease H [Promethearchaeota archaeon]|nr:MAG: Ribonuclease H [Candidatus Lokiarchaeota archaeon]